MSKRTLRSATLETQQNSKSSKSKKSTGHKTVTSTTSTSGVGSFGSLGRYLENLNWANALLVVASVVIILSLFIYFGPTTKALLYSIGVILALKTRIWNSTSTTEERERYAFQNSTSPHIHVCERLLGDHLLGGWANDITCKIRHIPAIGPSGDRTG